MGGPRGSVALCLGPLGAGAPRTPLLQDCRLVFLKFPHGLSRLGGPQEAERQEEGPHET